MVDTSAALQDIDSIDIELFRQFGSEECTKFVHWVRETMAIGMMYIPFVLFPRTSTCLLNFLLFLCDLSAHNKLQKIFPKLNDCFACPWTNRKEENVISQLHFYHSYITSSFLLKGEEPPTCITCDKLLTIEHASLHCSDLIELDSNSKTLFYKDCSLGSVKNLSNN